ncbi:ABC transporter permease, partial [uncultured Gemmiger sp.]|uniref:ABC transporter permease n=1 Tax=uncultured Gemmiger sp. TaxID=1623490 RepID=UPI0025FDB059
MNKALHTEFQKAHRRHDLWICLAVPLAAAIWSASAMPCGADELANAYSALLYSLPVLNTVLMPLAMAALASRLWDVEVKGCTVKLLYTLQTRRSLFAAKAVFGAGEILLMVLLELAATALLGYIQHYTEAFPAAQLAYLGVCTYGVNLMLFFSELLLMLVFSNPMP